MCLDTGAVTILQPRFEILEASAKPREMGGRSTSLGMRATPNNRVYWSISSGTPRTESGSRRPARKS